MGGQIARLTPSVVFGNTRKDFFWVKKYDLAMEKRTNLVTAPFPERMEVSKQTPLKKGAVMEEILKLMNGLSAEQLEKLIQEAAKMRAGKEPPVPIDPPIGTKAECTADPRYWTELDQFLGGSILGFRHPGMGWMFFQIPTNERSHLIDLLGRQNETQASQSQQPPGTLN